MSALRTSTLGTVGLVGFMCLLLVGTVASRTSMGLMAAMTSGNIKHPELVQREEHAVIIGAPALNYVSKRRVPNGPDPIHNRHVGESRRQPGRC